MYLQKLEVNGFKSFAKKISLEFDRGITAIVGPNGSGKSNVAEAVRWVMGEQSAKQLRAKRGQDVIFSGSDKAAQQGMAQVELIFNNEDPVIGNGHATSPALEYTELAIARKLYRDGHGEYFLNNTQTRLQDVQLLLAQVNLSSRTYSVIGQGMVDSILSMSASERKEFFEEASGVRPLQIKKHSATLKLDRTQENLQTAQIQLNEIAPRLRSLTRQVKRLERRTELENKLRDLQYHYYGETLHKFKGESEEFKTKEENLKVQIDKLEKELSGLQAVMASLTKESSHSDKFAKAQENYQELIEQKSELKEKELNERGELLRVAQESKSAQVPVSVVSEVAQKYEELNSAFHNLVDNFKKASPAKLESYHVEFSKLGSEFSQLLDPLKPYLKGRDISATERQLQKIQSQLTEVEGKLEAVQQHVKELAELEKKEKVKIWQTQNELQEQQKQLNSLSNEHNEVRVNLARVETRLSDTELEVSQEIGPEFLERLGSWQQSDKEAEHDDTDKLRDEMHKLKHELELIGGIDPEVQKEYGEIKERYDFLEGQLQDFANSIAQLQEVIDELDSTIKERFNSAFKSINHEFQKYFKTLFRGGRSELKLIRGEVKKIKETEADTEEVGLDENIGDKKTKKKDEIIGVEIHATPPGKRLKSIGMLSGGERALTSIALICAIIANNPAPFVVLDEVDAALDEENSARFGEIVEELSHRTQFIIITHNRSTMERADMLYGVTMGDDGISKILSLKLEAAAEYTNR